MAYQHWGVEYGTVSVQIGFGPFKSRYPAVLKLRVSGLVDEQKNLGLRQYTCLVGETNPAGGGGISKTDDVDQRVPGHFECDRLINKFGAGLTRRDIIDSACIQVDNNVRRQFVLDPVV